MDPEKIVAITPDGYGPCETCNREATLVVFVDGDPSDRHEFDYCTRCTQQIAGPKFALLKHQRSRYR